MLETQIPYYGNDGHMRGLRSMEAAMKLVADGHVTAAYGRKGHLRAIFARQEDGAASLNTRAHAGTRYSYRERLQAGNVMWRLKRLGRRDELRPIFLQVVTDCLVTDDRPQSDWGNSPVELPANRDGLRTNRRTDLPAGERVCGRQ